MKTLRERQMYLQAIQIDQSAPTPPPTVLDHGLYYERLQNLAFLSMHGKYKEVENVLNNKEIVDEKNIYLQPLFRQLKAWIRYISKTDEAEITKKFKQKLAGVIASNIEDKQPRIDLLREEYEHEILSLRQVDSQPTQMIKKLEKHITSLFHLLVTWMHYADIIYCPENIIKQMKFGRLNPESDKLEDSKQAISYFKNIQQREEELKYQTVEEAVTSDTAESADEDLGYAEASGKHLRSLVGFILFNFTQKFITGSSLIYDLAG